MNIFKKAILAACVALIGVSSAQAGTDNDELSVTVEVNPVCFIDTSYADTTIDWYTDMPVTGQGWGSHIIALCNEDLPYQIDLDFEAGGLSTLVDTSTGRQLQGHVYQSHFMGDMSHGYWGSIANGEARAAIGTGERQEFQYYLMVAPGYIPAVGHYVDEVLATIEF